MRRCSRQVLQRQQEGWVGLICWCGIDYCETFDDQSLLDEEASGTDEAVECKVKEF